MPQPENPGNPSANRSRTPRWVWFGAAGCLVPIVAVLTAAIYFVVVYDTYQVPTSSVAETILEGDQVLVRSIGAGSYTPAVGDIIIFRAPPEIPNYDPRKAVYLKRVAALPGDTLEITEAGAVIVNGNELDLAPSPALPGAVRGVVPAGEVFVIGDRSRNSFDSRFWGRPEIGKPIMGVPVENVTGKVVYRLGPPGRIGEVE